MTDVKGYFPIQYISVENERFSSTPVPLLSFARWSQKLTDSAQMRCWLVRWVCETTTSKPRQSGNWRREQSRGISHIRRMILLANARNRYACVGVGRDHAEIPDESNPFANSIRRILWDNGRGECQNGRFWNYMTTISLSSPNRAWNSKQINKRVCSWWDNSFALYAE